MKDEVNAFTATFGRTVINGETFSAVCDMLVTRGFEVHLASEVDRGVLHIPHKSGRRNAELRANTLAEPPPPQPEPEPQWTPEPIPVARVVVGIQVRACGSVHPDGVACMLPVYFETPACGCADIVYAHDGPHEASDEYGVSHRWNEILTIEDADFDCYADRVDADGNEWGVA